MASAGAVAVKPLVLRRFANVSSSPHCTTSPGTLCSHSKSVTGACAPCHPCICPQIGKNNAGEMVWWFFKSSEQYRVSGTLQVVGPTDPDVDLDIARMQQWSKLTDAAREQFYWLDADVPGRKSKADIPDGGRDKDGNVWFCGGQGCGGGTKGRAVRKKTGLLFVCFGASGDGPAPIARNSQIVVHCASTAINCCQLNATFYRAMVRGVCQSPSLLSPQISGRIRLTSPICSADSLGFWDFADSFCWGFCDPGTPDSESL